MLVLSVILAAAAHGGPGSAEAAEDEVPDGKVAACLGEKFILNQLSCLTDVAKAREAPSICLESEEPSVRVHCVTGYAADRDDLSVCGLLADEEDEVPGASQDICIGELAIRRGDPALCRSLSVPHMDDSCLVTLVERGGDPTLCEEIEVELLQETCQNAAAGQ